MAIMLHFVTVIQNGPIGVLRFFPLFRVNTALQPVLCHWHDPAAGAEASLVLSGFPRFKVAGDAISTALALFVMPLLYGLVMKHNTKRVLN
jgi:hypothetical protein